MTTRSPRYLAYMLRLWQSSSEKPDWRASLESPHTGERQGFASLDDLFDFLQHRTDAVSDRDDGIRE
ncbi:MAG: hypothetical protein KKA73_10165 [Chloroflexi bacterium]|nr:hypothetical protein [Chloroflexota bacterium]MBU1748041.1 hypothetical protein [Chloroflexota bacterium]MBU1877541.1 hypothetical protein [Chloroflexota bacterium]